jgi:hypothetical protein
MLESEVTPVVKKDHQATVARHVVMNGGDVETVLSESLESCVPTNAAHVFSPMRGVNRRAVFLHAEAVSPHGDFEDLA